MGWGDLTQPLQWPWAEWAAGAEAAPWHLQPDVTGPWQRHRRTSFVGGWGRDISVLSLTFKGQMEICQCNYISMQLYFK